MFRILLSVVAGYFTMAITVGLVFSVALFAPDFAFQAGSRDVTLAWIVYTLLASFVAAMLAGWVASRLAKTRRAGLILAGLVLVLGLVSAVGNESRRREVRPPYQHTETTIERATHAVQPTAYAIIAPLVGAAGSLVGAYRFRDIKQPSS